VGVVGGRGRCQAQDDALAHTASKSARAARADAPGDDPCAFPLNGGMARSISAAVGTEIVDAQKLAIASIDPKFNRVIPAMGPVPAVVCWGQGTTLGMANQAWRCPERCSGTSRSGLAGEETAFRHAQRGGRVDPGVLDLSPTPSEGTFAEGRKMPIKRRSSLVRRSEHRTGNRPSHPESRWV